MTVVDPIRDERGWAFRDGPGYTIDPVNGFQFLQRSVSRPPIRVQRPRHRAGALGQGSPKRIVNNSEDDICRMFNRRFRSRPTTSDLLSADIAAEQDALSEFIYENVNNGVYRAGFATTQAPTRSLRGHCSRRWTSSKPGWRRAATCSATRIVETDWRLFCTLIRFDAVYHGHFKCNVRRIVDYPNLQGYLRDLYQQPGIAETVNFDHIKRHYYFTHDDINRRRSSRSAPNRFDRPHGREQM